MERELIKNIQKSQIFSHMTEADIEQSLTCSNAKIKTYQKNEVIFRQGNDPMYLHVLISGNVKIMKYLAEGEQTIITHISAAGDLFGEVYLFLETQYDYEAVAEIETTVLELPKNFLVHRCSKNCTFHEQLSTNMLTILAKKAYSLNKKLQLLSAKSLRQKIAMYLYVTGEGSECVKLSMNREQLAEYLNVQRPSLARELSNLAKEGIIEIEKKEIRIIDMDWILEQIS